MCHIEVHRCFFVFDSIPGKYKTHEICKLTVSLYFPFIVYCPYKYITQEMCHEAVNDSLVGSVAVNETYSRLVCYKQND